jgi:hypothetical protein
MSNIKMSKNMNVENKYQGIGEGVMVRVRVSANPTSILCHL